MSVPTPMPAASASRGSPRPSNSLSVSYRHQYPAPTFTPSSPTPQALSSSSLSSSSGFSCPRRSSRISLGRRSASLPPTLFSSTPTAYASREREPNVSSTISGTGACGRMSMLQFISWTSTPSWAEVEASPLSMVPSILPSMGDGHDIDMVTFLREAPGVNRTPNLDDEERIWWADCANAGSADLDVRSPTPDKEDPEREIITPELRPVSLRAFLQEGAHLTGIAIESRNASLSSLGEIYSQGQKDEFDFCTYAFIEVEDVDVEKESKATHSSYECGTTRPTYTRIRGHTSPNGLDDVLSPLMSTNTSKICDPPSRVKKTTRSQSHFHGQLRSVSSKPSKSHRDRMGSDLGTDMQQEEDGSSSSSSLERNKGGGSNSDHAPAPHSNSVGRVVRKAVLDALRMGRA